MVTSRLHPSKNPSSECFMKTIIYVTGQVKRISGQGGSFRGFGCGRGRGERGRRGQGGSSDRGGRGGGNTTF